MKHTARPPMFVAITPILLLVALLAADVIAFGEDSSYGSNQVALLIASGATVALGMAKGIGWTGFESRIKDTLGDAIGAILSSNCRSVVRGGQHGPDWWNSGRPWPILGGPAMWRGR